MDQHVAKELMAAAVETDGFISRLFAIVEHIEDVETRTRFKNSVADLMGAIARDIIFPIEALYPDLAPEKA